MNGEGQRRAAGWRGARLRTGWLFGARGIALLLACALLLGLAGCNGQPAGDGSNASQNGSLDSVTPDGQTQAGDGVKDDGPGGDRSGAEQNGAGGVDGAGNDRDGQGAGAENDNSGADGANGLSAGDGNNAGQSQGGDGSGAGQNGASGANGTGNGGQGSSGNGAGQTEPPKAQTVTLSVTCKTALDNWDRLDPAKQAIVPDSGVLLAATSCALQEGDTAYDVLRRVTREQGLHMESTKTPLYKSQYIEGICNLYEFDCGELSGWMYRVNGAFPSCGCSLYDLKDGDTVEFIYTCDLGRDIGGEWDSNH